MEWRGAGRTWLRRPLLMDGGEGPVAVKEVRNPSK